MATTRLAFMRPVTTRLVNPITRRFAGRVPGFGVLRYTGRRSGRTYETPLNVFRHGNDYVLALTYGSEAQWVRNVMTAGGAELRERGRTVRLRSPRLVVDPSGRAMPLPVRLFLRLLGVTEYLVLTPV